MCVCMDRLEIFAARVGTCYNDLWEEGGSLCVDLRRTDAGETLGGGRQRLGHVGPLCL